MAELWVEKWRPNKFDDYVWKDPSLKTKFEEMIKEGSLPHLLLSGGAGVGKTSLALILLKALNVSSADILMINASLENGIEVIRTKITNFASTLGFGDYRYVLLDEMDYLSPAAQAGLRNMMETYSSVCRFIMTCNYPNKIIPAIKSRSQHFHFDSLDKDDFTLRVATILTAEEIVFDIDTLDTFVKACYPDLRKCINVLQQNSIGGKLIASTEASGTSDYIVNAIALFKQGKMTEGRKVIIAQATPEEYTDIFRFMYQNLELWGGDDENKQKRALLVIAKGLRNASLVADPEINLSATLVELEMLD